MRMWVSATDDTVRDPHKRIDPDNARFVGDAIAAGCGVEPVSFKNRPLVTIVVDGKLIRTIDGGE